MTAEGNTQTARASMALASDFPPGDFDVGRSRTARRVRPDRDGGFANCPCRAATSGRAAAGAGPAERGQVRVARSLSLPSSPRRDGRPCLCDVPTPKGRRTRQLRVSILYSMAVAPYDVVTAQENAVPRRVPISSGCRRRLRCTLRLRIADSDSAHLTAAELLAQAPRSEEVASGVRRGRGHRTRPAAARGAGGCSRAVCTGALTWFATFAQWRGTRLLSPERLRLSRQPDSTQLNSPR